MQPLELENQDKTMWIDKCDYYNVDKCSYLNPENFNLIILQLNIRSILAHQTELKALLHTLEQKNSPVDAVLLSETFLSKKTECLVGIPGYNFISRCQQNSKGGGVGILLKSGINYTQGKDLDMMAEKSIETIYIEITAKSRKKIVIGSLYHPPNTSSKPLLNHTSCTMRMIQSEQGAKETILRMDHNNDLLKCHIHPAMQEFLNGILENELMLTITRPTRITQMTASLLYIVFVMKNLHNNFDSLILIDDMSDHLPSLVLLKQTKIQDK